MPTNLPALEALARGALKRTQAPIAVAGDVVSPSQAGSVEFIG